MCFGEIFGLPSLEKNRFGEDTEEKPYKCDLYRSFHFAKFDFSIEADKTIFCNVHGA